MFLRRNRKKHQGEDYDYWTLVESVRTERGPRQRVVATIGKLPGLDASDRAGWEHIAGLLDGKIRPADLFAAPPEPPRWATIDTRGVRVERLRRFGDVFLALALWRRLKLDAFFNEEMTPDREGIPWATVACILTLARFCAPSSELRIADFWYGKTALDDLLGVDPDQVNDDRLYRGLDALLPHKDKLFGHLQKVYGDFFGVAFDLLLYDVTSTFFEGQAKGNPQAKRGYSRDSPLRKEKEKAMRSRQVEALQAALEKLQAATRAETRALRDRGKAERRVGKLLGRYTRAAHVFNVAISEIDDPKDPKKKRLSVEIARKTELSEWAALSDGCYLLRTNIEEHDAPKLWKTYIGLTRIEDSFRIAKHDPGLRPIFHHTRDRTQAHILVCFLSLVLWRTLQHWMESSGLGTAPRKLLEEMAEVRSLDVVLPTGAGTDLRLRTVSRAEKPLAILLDRLGLILPGRAKRIGNVVEKIGRKIEKPQQMDSSYL